MRKAQALADTAFAAKRSAHLMRIAYWLSGPFPDATELIVTVSESIGALSLTAIKDEGYRWSDDGGLSTCPDDYRTTDGANLDQLLDEIVLELDSLLGDDDPRSIWDQLEPNTYRVRLPSAGDLDRIIHGEPPAPDAGSACVLSHLLTI